MITIMSMTSNVRYLFLLAFTSGAVTLGMELSAARLLEPALGNNQIVWAALIGLILLYLAIGAWLGGKLADRFPRQRELDFVITLAALGVALVPALSQPVLRLAVTGLDLFAIELLAGAFVAIFALFSVPGILLGTVSPWVVRLALKDLNQSGQTAGRVYAISTAGSLIGAFAPVLWLIPAYGTRWTFFLLALALLILVCAGSIRHRHRWFPLGGLLLVIALALSGAPWTGARFGPGASIRAAWDDNSSGQILYEDESIYNYIAVRQWGSERHLKLNDGVGIHSVHHPESVLSLGIWDYFLLAPLFTENCESQIASCKAWTDLRNSPPATSHQPLATRDLLLLGLAAGTVSQLYTDIYGPLPITGVELDPQIIEVGQQYFDMNQPNLTAIAADARRWLMQQPENTRWDVVAIDAYRPPYIPFHLTTVEFFALVHAHLQPDGVVAINVGRTANNFALVDALAATLSQVFPSVFAIDEPGPQDDLSNTLLVATAKPITLDAVHRSGDNLPATLPLEFRRFVQETLPRTRLLTPSADGPILTDDHAPVERIVHQIIWEFLKGGG
jgi:predicted membrane-bound spermidine synthase